MKAYAEVEFADELVPVLMQETKVCGKYLKVKTEGYSTHYLIKVMGFWHLLKAESPVNGLIQNYIRQIPALCRNFNISKRTFFTYIKELEAIKLVRRDAAGHLQIASWHQMGDTFSIKTNKRTKINFEYAGKQKINWWFAALEIKGNKERGYYMIHKKVNKQTEIKNSIMTALIRRGFDTTKANNPEYLSGRLFMLELENFKTGTEVHDILIRIRSDVNRSCKKIGEAWNMSPQLVSYWKAQMRKQQIIEVAKLSVTWEWSIERNPGGKNKFCHVIYDKKKMERVWFLCDQIDVLMPREWEEHLKILEVA